MLVHISIPHGAEPHGSGHPTKLHFQLQLHRCGSDRSTAMLPPTLKCCHRVNPKSEKVEGETNPFTIPTNAIIRS